MPPSIKSFRPALFRQICAMQQDMIVAGGSFDRHAEALAELADWAEDLIVTGSAVVAESGPNASPSNGAIERLADTITKIGDTQ